MDNSKQSPAHQLFFYAFSQAFGEALSRVAGAMWEMHPVEALDESPVRADLSYVGLSFTGAVAGEAVLEFERSEAALLASLVLDGAKEGGEDRAPGDAGRGPVEAEALLSLVRSAVAEFGVLLTPGATPPAIEVKPATEVGASATEVVMFVASTDSGARVSVLLYVEPALLDALAAVEKPAAKAAPAAPAGKEPVAQLAPQPSAQQPPASGGYMVSAEEEANLKLVMGVELNVTLRFGQRRLSLREVLDLTSGSVIELDRQVDAPVELLLDGRVIARGEAVVIDGYYGLKVTEVPRSAAYQPGRVGEVR